jgi:hypothetical protein
VRLGVRALRTVVVGAEVVPPKHRPLMALLGREERAFDQVVGARSSPRLRSRRHR